MTTKFAVANPCTCCRGVGEHADGHECYVCDAGMTRAAQMESMRGEFCEGHHGVPDDGPENAKVRYGEDFEHEDYWDSLSASAFSDGYEGVTHAGLAIVALDTGRVLLAQRSYDETDDPDVQETWEFPGGGLNEGENPYAGAVRELIEETGWGIPDDATVVGGWRSEDGVYQGFVVTTAVEFPTDSWSPTDEVQAVAWYSRDDIEAEPNLRPEMAGTDWDMIFNAVSGNEDAMTASADAAPEAEPLTEPDLTSLDLAVYGTPVHGVLAPEDVETGDGRGFNAGSMTSRPGILPFSWQKSAIGGHDGSVAVGSVDRMMRKDGLIHWEGTMMASDEANEFAGWLAHFGRFGVSVDGDKGSLDATKTGDTGVMWFDAVRAAGLTAVAIPAFHEAYVAFGPHPDMPQAGALKASMLAGGDFVEFKRGPGWVTEPAATKRIHDYWTKKGEEGYAKIGWGTPGDFTRAKKLIGEKIAKNSPEDMRYLNQIIAQWHFDALGYWPGDLGKPGNAPDTPENRRRAATHASLEDIDNEGIEVVTTEDGESQWEAVLVSSVSGNRVLPPLEYFHYQSDGGALHIDEPDENGVQRVWGYAAQWGVCHVGFNGVCVEPPRTYSDDYPEFHLGRTKTDQGYISTGVLTYGVGHRDAETILNESPEQAYYDNVNNAWAAVRVGEDEIGIWFSGVRLPGVPEEHIVKIEASGQVSGEWRHDAMRACLTVNVPGFPVEQPSAVYDENGNVMALAASAYGGVTSPCTPTPAEIVAALRSVHEEAEHEAALATFANLREQFNKGGI